MSLLKKLGNSDDVWELIRMLATNEKILQNVLDIEIGQNSREKFWKTFFESGNSQ